MGASLLYAGCGLDRADRLRNDAGLLAQSLLRADTRVLPVLGDRNLIDAGEPARLLALSGAAAAAACAAAADVAFLGVDAEQHAWFACDLGTAAESAVAAIANGGRFADIGSVATKLDAAEASVLAYARALLHWHRRHRFCGTCGAATRSARGGHLRVCTSTGCGVELFPRTDPVVLMLVTRQGPQGDECLLARQPRWIPGLFSTLAGFVEPGESLEEAVIREVREEAGLVVRNVSYGASQPWPFPGSLMLGFRAEALAPGELVIDHEELEDARWFSRADVLRIRALGLRLPYRGTIARWLIDGWLAEAAAPAAAAR